MLFVSQHTWQVLCWEVSRPIAWPSHSSEAKPSTCYNIWCVLTMKRTLCLFFIWKTIKIFAWNKNIFGGKIEHYCHKRERERINKPGQTLWDVNAHQPREWLNTLLADPYLKESACSALNEACLVSYRYLIICNSKPLLGTHWSIVGPVNSMRY